MCTHFVGVLLSTQNVIQTKNLLSRRFKCSNALFISTIITANIFYLLLCLSRLSIFTAAQELETIKKQYVKITDAYGCLGVLQVNAGESSQLYLVLVTSCFSVGKLYDSEVFRITQTQFVPLQFQAPGTNDEKIAEVNIAFNFLYSN